MKLCRVGAPGSERHALVAPEGLLDPSSLLAAVASGDLATVIDRLREADTDALPRLPPGARTGCPIANIGKVVCVGLNYRDHAEESGMRVPDEPVLFMKAPSAVCGPFDDIRIPGDAAKVDWEVELGVVIARTCRRVALSDVPRHIAGYTIVHDVSERSYQLERGGQWLKGKSLDTFCPIGPWLVTPDEVPAASRHFSMIDRGTGRSEN